MFGLKKKRDPVDVVDITLLQKKGLYPIALPSPAINTSVSPSASAQNLPDSQDFIDASQPSADNGLDFLSSFATAAQQNEPSSNSSEAGNIMNNNTRDIEFSSLKSSVDRISDRIIDIVERIEKIERKIESQ
ncbi:MAG: hypothetical protein AABX65_04760 [Nanoarchaeota archaeon]